VNVLGCPQGMGIILEEVTFTSGTSNLTADARKGLDKIAEALLQLPQIRMEVAGHTDSIGDAILNLQLSTQRAQAVVTYLVDKGIAADRLVAKGYGEDFPIADNATAAGRNINRRVEFHILEE